VTTVLSESIFITGARTTELSTVTKRVPYRRRDIVWVPERVAARSSGEKLTRQENGLTGKPAVPTLPHKKL